MLKRENPQSIEEYSEALRKRLVGVLPHDKIDEVVAETEAHLEDRAEELRRNPEVFEARAVADYVPAARLARGINRAWAPTFLRHQGTRPLQNFAAVIGVFAVIRTFIEMFAYTKFQSSIPWSIPLFLMPPSIIFILSLVACRPQVRRFTFGGLSFLAVAFVLGGWFCVSDGRGVLSRFDAPNILRQNLEMQHEQQREIRLLEKGLKHFGGAIIVGPQGRSALKPETPLELKVSEKNIVPNYPWENEGVSAFRKTAGSSISSTGSPEQTMGRWYNYGREQLGRLNQWTEMRRQRMYPILELMASSKWRFDLQAARNSAVMMSYMIGILIVADLLGGYLGMAILRSHRRRQAHSIVSKAAG